MEGTINQISNNFVQLEKNGIFYRFLKLQK